MDFRMVISLRPADIPFKSHDVPVAVSRTNLSPLSYATFRDCDLVNDLRQFAVLHNLVLDVTYMTSYLLHLLLTYRKTFKPTGPAESRVQNAIRILEREWKVDIKDWSENEDFTFEDPSTGDVLWNTHFVMFINLILQPLQNRSAYVFLDRRGDISGQTDAPGIWRHCQFKAYSLDRTAKTFELQFQIKNQKKGLVLNINDMKRLDHSGIHFQHPTNAACFLFDPFSCDEFARPRHYDSAQLKKRMEQGSPKPNQTAHPEVF